MAVVALASARSPGLTTTVLALAVTWPRPAVLAELDPAGGTIAARVATSPDPGLKTLAASGRHYLWSGLLLENLQRLSNGVAVLMAPASPDRTVAALGALNPVDLPGVLQSLPGYDVLVDCGRIDSRSPALPVLRAADAAIFVIRPTLDDIVGLRDRLETLDLGSSGTGATRVRAGIVTVGPGRHDPGELADVFSIPVVGAIDWDPRAAAVLGEGRRPSPSSRLLRAAERLAADIAGQVPAAGLVQAADPVGDGPPSPSPVVEPGSSWEGRPPSASWGFPSTAGPSGVSATSREPARP